MLFILSTDHNLTQPPGTVSSAIISLEGPPCALVLRCGSRGWYPRPQLSWTLEGLHLPAGPMNTIQDPSGLYTISSTVVVVELSQGHRYTCRVHQEGFNQTRETKITIAGASWGEVSLRLYGLQRDVTDVML